MGNAMEKDLQMTADSDFADLNIDEMKLPVSTSDLALPVPKGLAKDEVPEDIRAFFGHPLTAATSALDGTETQASALALLHEYQNLPAIDRADLRIGDRYESIQDILRADLRRDGAPTSADYMMLMNADVDAYLNREDEAKADLSLAGLEEDENANMVMSLKGSDAAEEEFMQSLHKAESALDSCVPSMSLLDSDDTESLLLPEGIKQERPSIEDNAGFPDIHDVEMASSDRDQHNRLGLSSQPSFGASGEADSPTLSEETIREQASTGLNQSRLNGHATTSTDKFIPAFARGGVLPPFRFVRASPPRLTPDQPETAPPGTPTTHLPHPHDVLFPMRLPSSPEAMQQTPDLLSPVPISLKHVSCPLTETPLTSHNGETLSNLPSVQTLVPVHVTGTPTTNAMYLEHDAQKYVATSLPNLLSLSSAVSMASTLASQSKNAESLHVPVTGINTSMPAYIAQSLMALHSNPNLLLDMQDAIGSSFSKTNVSDPGQQTPSHTASTPPATPVSASLPVTSQLLDTTLVKHFASQASAGAIRPPLTPGGHPFPLTRPQLIDLQRLQLAGVPGIPAALTLMSPRFPPPPNYQEVAAGPRLPQSPPVSHPLPPTPAASSDSNSVPSSPLPRRDPPGQPDNGSCSPDAQKPSDSTKRIIQALTEKLKRKKEQTSLTDDESRVSLNDINDIIKESIADKTGLPESIAMDGNLIDQALVTAALESGHLAVFDLQKSTNSNPPNTPGPVSDAKSPNTTSASPQTCSPDTLASPSSLPQLCTPLSFPGAPATAPTALFFPDVYNFQQVPARTFPPPPDTPSPSPATTPLSDNEAPPLVIQPQESFLPQTPLQPPAVPYGDLKSPDSGFNEACVSPADPNLMYNDLNGSESGALGVGPCRDRVGKRRRSSSSASAKGFTSNGGGSTKPPGTPIIIPKLENDFTGYSYVLETNTSTSQRLDEDRMTYLNKGQFYGLTLDYNPAGRPQSSSMVKSLIVVVFRDDKCMSDELKAWEFWHSRQHSVKQRILDIDTKNSTGVVPNSIDEVAHNAVTVRWNPLDSAAKISVAINCLSTDFSNQKGVKGLPLHIQIDTFEESSPLPVHRGYCQVKVFCDKGAERKTRDEERRKEAKSKTAESADTPPTSGSFLLSSAGRKRLELYHPCCERSEFYPMANLTKRPVLFNPIPEYSDANYSVDPFRNSTSPFDGRADGLVSPGKRPRLDSKGCRELERVLLYVRESHETVYTALLLQSPTLQSLAQAVEEKYQISASSIHNIYKRSKRGILVKMDDNIIRHYSNETTFVIAITKNEHMLDCQSYNVTLAEIETEEA